MHERESQSATCPPSGRTIETKRQRPSAPSYSRDGTHVTATTGRHSSFAVPGAGPDHVHDSQHLSMNPLPFARLLCAALVVACLSSPALAQEALPLQPAMIKPYATMWRVTITKPDGTKLPQGLWSDQVIIAPYKGKPAIRRIQGMTYVNGQSATWTNVLEASTLLPLADIQHGQRLVITREFVDNVVRTQRQRLDGTPPDSSQVTLRGAVYDYLAGTYGLLFATLPLADGYTAKFLSIDGATDSVRTVQIKVTGREPVNAGGGRTLLAWKVVDGDLTYFVSDQVSYVLKLVETLPDGAVMTWELPS